MRFLPKALFYYSVVASLLITVSLVLTSNSIIPVIFAILFLPVAAYFITEFFKQMRTSSEPISGLNKGSLIISSILFLVLLSLGLRNIYINKQDKNLVAFEPIPTATPLVFKKSTPTPTLTLTISITDGAKTINIRSKPTIYSEIISEAKNGDTFSYTKKAGEWYEVILPDGKIGYISFKYVEGDKK